MIRSIIIHLATFFLKKEVVIDSDVSNRYLMRLLLGSLFKVLRGYFLFLRLCFVGCGVTLVSKSRIKLGRSVRLADFVFMDAEGKKGIVLSDRVSIGPYTRIAVSGSLRALGQGVFIGADSAIGDFSHIGGAGGVTIGNDTICGSYLSIHPENHNFTNLDIPIRLQGVNHQGITIGNNCWIGAKVTILDGAKIGDGCIVAAGAVVRGHFPDNVILGGVPAKIIRQRGNE